MTIDNIPPILARIAELEAERDGLKEENLGLWETIKRLQAELEERLKYWKDWSRELAIENERLSAELALRTYRPGMIE